VMNFGVTSTYDDDCGAIERGCKATAYRISARYGKAPLFYREAFRSIKGRWITVGSRTRLLFDKREGD